MKKWVSVFLLFHALAIAWTWPLLTHIGSRIAHDPGDPILTTWILWWNAQTLPFTAGWWDPPFLYPLRGGLALSEHLAGISLFATPLQRAGASALLAQNVCLILSYSLSGFFAFLLARRLTGSTFAGICGGLAYGFAPYRAGQLAHLQVLASEWIPLMLLAMHEYLDAPRWRMLLLFAGAWLIQALSNGYYLLFLPVLIGLWLAWFVDWRVYARRGAAIAVTWMVASLPLLPVLWKYRTVQSALGLSRPITDMQQFSAGPSSLLHAAPLLAFWPSVPARTEEDYLFPGVTCVLLVIIALAIGARRGRVPPAFEGRGPLLFYTGCALMMYALSFGPALPGSGVAAVVHPYAVLTFLPGFSGLRAPARFAMLAELCLSVAGALAICIVMRTAGRVRTFAGAFVLAGLFVDGWMMPMPLAGPPGRIMLPDIRDSVVLELPTDNAVVNVGAMYRQMFHRRPLINGYTGYVPPHYAILSLAIGRGDPSVVVELARGHPLLILVNDASDPRHDWAQYVEGLPGIEPVGAGSGGRMYVLRAQPNIQIVPPGTPLLSTTKAIDPENVQVDLGGVHTVRTIDFPVRWHYGELARSLTVEISSDGITWSRVWENWTGGPTLSAALRDPLLVPVRLTLPDVRARYLRVHPAPRWLARAITVEGP